MNSRTGTQVGGLVNVPVCSPGLRDGMIRIEKARVACFLSGVLAMMLSLVTISEASAVEVPPRTASDITSLLVQYRPDPTAAEEMRRIVDTQPPANLSERELMRFFYERAEAADALGLIPQALRDYRQAFAHSGNQPFELIDAFHTLLHSLTAGGSFREALELQNIGRSLAGHSRQRNTPLAVSTREVRHFAALGMIPEARDALVEAERIGRSSSGGGSRRQGRDMSLWPLELARAAVFRLDGKFREEETALRNALSVFPSHQAAASENRERRGGFSVAARQANARDAAERTLAINLMRQGRTAEAEFVVRNLLVNVLKRSGRSTPNTASTIATFGEILVEQGRYEEARSLLSAALETYRASGVIPEARSVAETRARVAAVHVAQGQWLEAAREFDDLRATLKGTPPLDEVVVRRNLDWSLALIRTGRAEETLAVLDDLVRTARRDLGDGSLDTAERRGVFALALAAVGQRVRALEQFAEATKVLIALGRASGDDTVGLASRGIRRRLILEGYVALLGELVKSEEISREKRAEYVGEAFRIADAARGGSVRRALAASAARSAVDDPGLSDLIRKQQDGRQQADLLYGLLIRLSEAASDQQVPKIMADIRARIREIEAEQAQMLKEIERRFPRYADLIDPKPPTVADIQRRLGDGEVLLSLYVAADRAYVWAIPAKGGVVFASVQAGAGEIEELVAATRRSLDSGATSVMRLPRFDVAAAHRLYQLLLEPVVSGWGQAKHLIVVPHGPVGMLPFGLLLSEPAQSEATEVPFAGYQRLPWLIRKLAITQLPSADALVTMRAEQRQRPAQARFAGFGDPLFSREQAAQAEAPVQLAALDPSVILRRSAPKGVDESGQKSHSVQLGGLPRLPDTAAEILGIAASLGADPKRDVFLGRDANERNAKEGALRDRSVIAFATHGLIPGDLNGLEQPALALSAPEVAGVEGDGLLTMEEILRMKLNADWVVLSACNTGTADGRGAEAVSGLGRAFFYAGARALLVSNWPVETTSARKLTTEIFRLQAADPTLTRSEALRRSMLALLDGAGLQDGSGKTLFSFAHPLFWAPFTLVGEGTLH